MKMLAKVEEVKASKTRLISTPKAESSAKTTQQSMPQRPPCTGVQWLELGPPVPKSMIPPVLKPYPADHTPNPTNTNKPVFKQIPTFQGTQNGKGEEKLLLAAVSDKCINFI